MTFTSQLVPDKKAICSDCNSQIYEEDGSERVEQYYIDLNRDLNVPEDLEIYMRCNNCLDEMYEIHQEVIDDILRHLSRALIEIGSDEE